MASDALEWVRMPNRVYFCTICQNVLPIYQPTRYLLRYVYPGARSPQTVRLYGQWLLPFFKSLDQQGLAFTDIIHMDLDRFRDDLTIPYFPAKYVHGGKQYLIERAYQSDSLAQEKAIWDAARWLTRFLREYEMVTTDLDSLDAVNWGIYMEWC